MGLPNRDIDLVRDNYQEVERLLESTGHSVFKCFAPLGLDGRDGTNVVPKIHLSTFEVGDIVEITYEVLIFYLRYYFRPQNMDLVRCFFAMN